MSQDNKITLVFWKNEGLALTVGDWRHYYDMVHYDDGAYNAMKEAAQDYYDLLKSSGYVTERDENIETDRYYVIHDATTPNRFFQRVFHPSDIRSLSGKYEKDETFSTGWYNIDCFIECLYDVEHDLTQSKIKKEDICR